MYKITDRLAVHGLDLHFDDEGICHMHGDWYEGEFGYISDKSKLKTGHTIDYDGDKWVIVDCRDISDSPDVISPPYLYRERIMEVGVYLELDQKVAICCSAGQSRSSSICIGALIKYHNMDYYDAYELVRRNNPICNIANQHLDQLKYLYNVTLP